MKNKGLSARFPLFFLFPPLVSQIKIKLILKYYIISVIYYNSETPLRRNESKRGGVIMLTVYGIDKWPKPTSLDPESEADICIW